jgi:FHS family Na+ dependent glucose MFS transporter 1
MLIVLAAGMILFTFIGSMWFLLVVTLFLGFAESFIDIGGNTLLPWQYEDDVSPYMNAMHFCFGVGAFVAPFAIGVVLNNDWPLYWFFLGFAVLSLPVALLLVRTPSPKVRIVKKEQGEGGIPWAAVIPLALMLFLYVGSEVGFGDWISSYAINYNLGNPANAAYLTSAFWGALMVGRLLSVPLAARIRPSYVLLGSLTGILASMGIFFLVPVEPLGTWLATIGLGFSMAAVFPTIIAFAERHHKITGQMNSIFFIGVSLGGMSLPWLMGQLFEAVDPNWAMLVVVFATIVSMGAFLFVRGTEGESENYKYKSIS